VADTNEPAGINRPTGGAPGGHRFAVVGHATMEIVVSVGRFPVAYTPARTIPGGISVGVSGTAYNLGTALWRLGNTVDLCVPLGADPVAAFVAANLPADHRLRIISAGIGEQPLTAVLAAEGGQRMILNDYRSGRDWHHEPEQVAEAVRACDVLVLPVGGVNAGLAAHARAFGKPVACDVHAIASLAGEHEPWCESADILFMSHERLPVPAEDWLGQVMARWPARIAVVGQGERGAVMAVRGEPDVRHVPAAPAERVAAGALGAGDALCAAFLDGHARGLPPVEALARATVFAAAKVSARGGGTGFLTGEELKQRQKTSPPSRR
jgi:ribokinase